MWKFALAVKGPKSSVISSLCFLRLCWQLAVWGAFSGWVYTQGQHTAEWPNGELIPWFLHYPFGACSFLSFLPSSSFPNHCVISVVPLFQVMPVFWFPFWQFYNLSHVLSPLTSKKQKLILILIYGFIQSTNSIECDYSTHVILGARETASSTLKSLPS